MDDKTKEIALLKRHAANLGRLIARAADYDEGNAHDMAHAIAGMVTCTVTLEVIQNSGAESGFRPRSAA